MHVTEKSFEKGRVNRGGKLHCCLKILPQPQLLATTTHNYQPAATDMEARPSSIKVYNSLKAQMVLTSFSHKMFLN